MRRYVVVGLTTCGMMVMLDRNASRLRVSVGMPSYNVMPSVMIQRRRAKVNELCVNVSQMPRKRKVDDSPSRYLFCRLRTRSKVSMNLGIE